MSDFEQLKPCPFCGGRAELDTQRGFLAFPNGKLENQVAVYCAGDDPCLADMSICYSDHPDVHPDVVVRWAVDQWNTRSAIASMQVEAKPVGMALQYGGDKTATVFDAEIVPIGTQLFTYQPSASAEIARLQKELEEARKDARRLVELVIVTREWYWVPCSQQSDYANHELFPRNQKFPGTNQNNNKTPMWNAIDAAIRQIGGAE